MLVRIISHDREAHCGIRLLTNGGTLIKTDEADTGCVYFQCELPSQIGHFEAVCDVDGRFSWGADDAAVMCLRQCMVKMQLHCSVRDMRRKKLTAAQNRINTVNETFQPGDCAWLTVPVDVVQKVARTLTKRREQQDVNGKMLVRIVSMHVTQASVERVPSQQFTVCTEDGQLERACDISELKLCYPPPESTLFRIVDLDLSSLTYRRVTLRKAYKLYISLLSLRQEVNASTPASSSSRSSLPQQAESSAADYDASSNVAQLAVSSATDGSSEQDLTSATQQLVAAGPSISTDSAAASSVCHSFSARQRRAALRSEASAAEPMDSTQAAALASLPAVEVPCTFCDHVLGTDDSVSCYNSLCQAPFHQMVAGCKGWKAVLMTEGAAPLYYCRQACAQLDRGRVAALIAHSSSLPAWSTLTAAADSSAAATSSTAAASSLASSASAAAAVGRSAVTQCSSCLQSMQWKKGAGCASCLAYHHKVGRGKPGCTRAGWSKDGSLNVDGIIMCVPCRYRNDSDWRRFIEQPEASSAAR